MARTVLMDNRHPEEDTDNESEEIAQKIVTAASEGRTEVVRTLLSGGARVNAKYKGWTALGRASKSGYLDVVHVLIESGANLDIKWTKDGVCYLGTAVPSTGQLMRVISRL